MWNIRSFWSAKQKSAVDQRFRGLSTRKLQAIAALCLAQFCAVRKIQHPAIDHLIEHMLKLLISVNLPAWEQEGARLDLPGRGDPLPRSLAAILPPDSVDEFYALVDTAVEVGLVDMYAKESEHPRRFLNECIRLLHGAGVELPAINDLFDSNTAGSNEEGYGLPVDQAVYTRALQKCRAVLRGAALPSCKASRRKGLDANSLLHAA